MASRPSLGVDIWYKVASEYLSEASDVFHLAITCPTLWEMLQKQVYITDVLQYKIEADAGRLRHISFESGSRSHIEQCCGPVTPMSGSFPDQYRWEFGEELEKSKQSDIEDLQATLKDSPPDSEWLRFYKENVAAYPDPLPNRVPPLSVLQWAATNGINSTAVKVINAAKKFWPEYLHLGQPQNLHKPIHLAIINSHLDMAKLLVDLGAASPTTTSGLVCLAPKMLHEVITHVAPNVRLEKLSAYFSNNIEYPFVFDALGLSILREHDELATWLLERYDISQYHERSGSPSSSSSGSATWLDIPYKDLDKRPAICPLHLAALLGMNHIVQGLLKKGVPVNFVSEQFQGSTALMFACARPGNIAVIETLIMSGADIMHRDALGRTALTWAFEHLNPEAASLLIKAGLPVGDWVSSGGRVCALSLSVKSDMFLDCTKLILKIHPNLPPTLFAQCFNEALQNYKSEYDSEEYEGNDETLRMFAEDGIGQGPLACDLQDSTSASPRRGLISAAASWKPISLSIMRLLLEKNSEGINTPDRDGNTPLLAASDNFLSRGPMVLGSKVVRATSKKPDYKKMALLLEFGADPKSCLDYIEESEDESDSEPDEDGSVDAYIKSLRRGMSTKKVLTRWFAKAAQGDHSEVIPTHDGSTES